MAFTTTTGAGGTSLIGTSGVDTAALSANAFPLYIGAQANNDIVTFSGNTTSVTAELGKGNDSFTIASSSTLGSSTISGNLGNDTITLTGTLSTGLINGNQGADSITIADATGGSVLGGADNDVISIGGNLSGGAKVNGNKGNDEITVTGAYTNALSTIYGGEGNDTLVSDSAANILSGDEGADTLTGAGGADTLFGGNGNDRINAGTTAVDAATDSLVGGAGVDTFVWAGNTGASGSAVSTDSANLFSGSKASGTVINADIITDFTSGSNGDVVDLNGTGTFTWGGTANTSTVLAGSTYYAFSGTWSNGTFTFGSSSTGTDTLIALTGSTAGNILTTKDAVVLVGVSASTVTTANVV